MHDRGYDMTTQVDNDTEIDLCNVHTNTNILHGVTLYHAIESWRLYEAYACW